MDDKLLWFQWQSEGDIYLVVAHDRQEALDGLLKLLHDENDRDYIVHAESPTSYLIREKYEDEDDEDLSDPDDDENEYEEYTLSEEGPFVVGYPLYLDYL
jgi:hypothetical protein